MPASAPPPTPITPAAPPWPPAGTRDPAAARVVRPAGAGRRRRAGGGPIAVPPHVWFAGRLLEVLVGRRPVGSLAGRVPEETYDQLWRLVTARADWRRLARRPHLRRCRCAPTPSGALEVTAVIALDHDCVRALAFRLERGPERTWHCTAIEAR
jgi:hypothetical protein